MLWLKKNSYKEFDNEKKFLRLENSPPPPITFLMVRPLSLSLCYHNCTLFTITSNASYPSLIHYGYLFSAEEVGGELPFFLF